MTPLQFVIINGDKIERKDYVSSRTEEFKEKYPLLKELDESLVNELFTVCDQDKNLSADNPKEFFEIIEDICGDIEETKASLRRREEIKEIDFSNSFVRINEKFDFGTRMTCLRPRDGTTISVGDLEMALACGFAMENSGQWVVADAVAYLEDMGEEDVVNQLCAQLRRPYSTVSNWARVGRRVDPILRPKLPFTVFSEIALARIAEEPKDNEKAILELLEAAVEEGWSSREARDHVNHARNPDKSMDTASGKKRLRYLMILSGEPIFTYEMPAWSEGALIFDLKDNKMLKEVEGTIEWCEVEKEPI